jgi:hypothetical protein
LTLAGPDFTEPVGGERSTEDEAVDLSEGAGSVGDIEKVIASVDQKIKHGDAVQHADKVFRENVTDSHHCVRTLVKDERSDIRASHREDIHGEVNPEEVEGEGDTRHFLREPPCCFRGCILA